jgi:hypothetical protein
MALIENVLAGLPPDQRLLRVDFDRTDGGYVARAVLAVSQERLTVQTEAAARDPDAVIDQLADRLADAARESRGVNPVIWKDTHHDYRGSRDHV